MLIKMLVTHIGRNCDTDLHTKKYLKDKVYDLTDTLGGGFIDSKLAITMDVKGKEIKRDQQKDITEDEGKKIEKDRYLEYTDSDINELAKEPDMSELRSLAEYLEVDAKLYPRMKHFLKVVKKQLNIKRSLRDNG